MELHDIQTLNFPNIFSLKENIVKIKVRLCDLEDTPTKDITGFNEKIIQWFPKLSEHKCSLGYAGGFIKRLHEGTYIPHVMEHLCLELQLMLGYEVKFGKARKINQDIYNIIFECPNCRIGKISANFIWTLINNLIKKIDFDFELEFNNLKRSCSKVDYGPSTTAIIKKAKTRDIPISEIDNSGILRLGYGKFQKLLSSTIIENTSCISVDIACDKSLTKFLLNEEGIPTPIGSSCFNEEEAVLLGKQIGYPVVMKPKHGNHGKFVFVDIKNEQILREAFNKIISFDKEVIIEKFIAGNDYRLLIVDGKFIAASHRIKAHVVGDGIHTIKNLINNINQDELRGDAHEKPLTKIIIDESTKKLLKEQNVELTTIPLKDQVIWLKDTANLSTGGHAIDCTEQVHIKNRELAKKAAACIDLDIAGIDIITPDISKPLDENFGAIVEVNAAPGLRMHIFPSFGKSRDVASPILDMLYPNGSPHSVPIISITGTNGKTTTTRMISHILQNSGFIVGKTTTDGIFIGNNCVESGDTTGPKSAKKVLNNRKIDVAVLETARGGILREGLGYQKADVAVFTNFTGDHVGVDNINTMDELFHIKSLVIEAVKDTGTCILNADDPWVKKAIEHAKGRIILTSLSPSNDIVTDHLKKGGHVIYADNNSIYIANMHFSEEIMKINDIPATVNGKLKNNIYNSLSAIGACIGLDISIETIIEALKSFHSNVSSNPGRFNIFDMPEYRIVLDYGHNYDGYKSTIECLKALNHNRLVGIIGVPGDRKEQDIIDVGILSGKSFDKIIIKEDRCKRGRAAMEVSNILYDAAIKGGISKDSIEIILSEEDALKTTIQNAKPGDLIVMFYEKFEPAIKIIENFHKLKELSVKV